MSHDWLHLCLAAPLVAHGGVAVDQRGPTRDFPAASALTGLLANALGWHWRDRAAHAALQDRMVFGAVIARQGRRVTDSQNAQLAKADKGWTTFGTPEERAGGTKTYSAPHRRRRDYLADHEIHIVVRLAEDDEGLDLGAVESALTRPARPLFIGRKSCLPTGQILRGRVQAETAHAALMALSVPGRALWPEGNGPMARSEACADLRNWNSGVHAGSRTVMIGSL